MRRIDGWLIEILERYCHWLQRLTGVTSAHMANASYLLASFWLVLYSLSGASKLMTYFNWFILIGFFL